MRAAYLVGVGVWGLAPGDFWRMSPAEWWWFFESKIDPDQLVTPDDKWGELYEWLMNEEPVN